MQVCRRKEISSLTLSSFALYAEPPTVTVEASYSKRKRRDTQVLNLDVAERLRVWPKTRNPAPTAYLFPISRCTSGWDHKTSKMMRHDLEVAQKAWIAEATSDSDREQREQCDFLSYRDETGLFADFHANRHTTAFKECPAFPVQSCRVLSRSAKLLRHPSQMLDANFIESRTPR
jgi:hypothetical protein